MSNRSGTKTGQVHSKKLVVCRKAADQNLHGQAATLAYRRDIPTHSGSNQIVSEPHRSSASL